MLCVEFGKVLGIKAMDQTEFQDWLTATQRAEAARVLSPDADEERSVAAVERGVGESRICPRCGEGKARGRVSPRGQIRNAENRIHASGFARGASNPKPNLLCLNCDIAFPSPALTKAGRGDGRRAGHRRGSVLPALRAITWIVPHRAEPIRRTANSKSLPHPDGRQPTKPLQGVPVPLPRRRDEIPRKLPSVVPTRLPRSRRQFGMHTNREMSQQV